MPMFLTGRWTSAIGVLNQWSVQSPNAVDFAIRDEALYYQRKVVESFRKQGSLTKWKPLNPITIALRKNAGALGRPASRGTKALVATGALRRSVKMHREGYARYFVGVHRKEGRAMTNIAMKQETGLGIIPITDKMRRYFRVLFWKGIIPYPWPAEGKRYIIAPRRSFIGDPFKVVSPGHEKRLLIRYANHLGGFGKTKLTEK